MGGLEYLEHRLLVALCNGVRGLKWQILPQAPYL